MPLSLPPISVPAHRQSIRRLTGLAVGVLSVGLVLSGCSNTAPLGGTVTGSASSGFPVTISGALGSATISARPARVASVSWGNQDVAIGLGIVPVTMASANYGDDNGDGYLPWTLEALQKLGTDRPSLHDETDGIPFESISTSRPDVILGAYSGFAQEDFDTLNKIAPTVGYPKLPWSTSWKDTTLIDAQAMGKTAEATVAIAAVEAKMAGEAAKYPSLAGKTFAYIALTTANPDVISYYTPIDARVEYVTQLGLVNSPTIASLSKGSTEFYGTISAENADTIDADIVIMYVDDTAALDSVKNSPLLSQIPAVKRGSIVSLTDTTFIAATSSPTLLSIPWMIERYVALLGAAAARV